MNTNRHSLSFCNAGHENPVLLRTDGGIDRLATGGMALGVLEDFPYEEGDATLGPGDILVIYSDGIPDAVNEFEHPFGEERLIACVRDAAAQPAGEILRRVVAAVREHEHGAERIDDLTIMVVKRTR